MTAVGDTAAMTPDGAFEPDPRPLVTLWSGPVLGALAPLAIAWATGDNLLGTARLLARGGRPATIAAYCLLAIGVGYVGFRRQCVRLLSPSTGGPPGPVGRAG